MKVKELIDKLLDLPAKCIDYDVFIRMPYGAKLIPAFYSAANTITTNDELKRFILADDMFYDPFYLPEEVKPKD